MEIVIFLGGVVLGWLLSAILNRPRKVGTLRIDNSDHDGPYLFVELGRNVNDLTGMRTVTFDVKCEDFIPQK